MAEPDHVCVCLVCEREIDACACCEDGRCENAICHRDLLFAMRESMAQPHHHGG